MIEKMARSSKKTKPSTFPGLKPGGCSRLIPSGAFAPVLKDGVWRRRSINFYLLILILLSSLGVEKGLSQPLSKEESAPQIRLENVTFQVREIESTPSPLKILEVHVEILNRSQRLTAPPNSIKAVVDAYDGSVAFYASDADDPILRTYAKIFPGVFKKLSDMPVELQQHVRYPPGMLSIQARMYRAYHMQDPQVFYNKEDLWAVPRKDMKGADQEMEPYYTIMRLPGEKQEEFILLLPFTPRNKDNMSAWMAARCDAPNYGKVIVYNFPKQKLVYGPRQIEARIDQDTEISKQLSLWNQGGSQVIRGSLLAIPIEKSILYVESLYLAAEKGQLPELKRVIVAFGNAIAMEENLELALQRIFGGELMREKEFSTVPVAAAAMVKEKSDRQLVVEALSHYRKAQESLRQGNWGAYGEELKKMDDMLRSIERKN